MSLSAAVISNTFVDVRWCRSAASDEELYMAMREGDDQSLRVLMDRHQPMARALCRNIVGDAAEADDVVQDVFFSVWRRGGWVSGDARFVTWLHRVLINRAIDHRRRRRDIPTADDTLTAAAELRGDEGRLPDAEAIVTRQEASDRLRAALLRLPETQRLVMEQHYFEDADVPEIVARTGASENAVRSLLKRGRMALREDLRKQKKIWADDLDRLARQS